MAVVGKSKYTAPVLADTVVIVSDVHLGHASERSASSFHRFLESVPDLGTHLVINGDLFDFWFEYRSVIPRHAFHTLSLLRALRCAGIRLTVTGGNHDRWGGDFWREDLDATFLPDGGIVTLAGWRTLLAHGDGLSERHLAAKVMHRVTRWRLTQAAFRMLHPDMGFRLVDFMSGGLADQTRDPAVLDAAARAQAEWARDYLATHADTRVVVLSHTHRAALEAPSPDHWYLNPGSWMDGGRYALLTPSGPTLLAFEESRERNA